MPDVGLSPLLLLLLSFFLSALSIKTMLVACLQSPPAFARLHPTQKSFSRFGAFLCLQFFHIAFFCSSDGCYC